MALDKLIESLGLPESFHEVDEDDLAGEWVRQPGNYLTTAIKLAKAEREEASAKAALEEKFATLSKAVRQNPEKYRVTKIVNEVVENEVLTNKDYLALQKVHIQAAYLVKLLKAATGTLEHKKKALENLVYLAGQGMHAAPKARTEDRKKIVAADMRKASEKAQNGIARKPRP